MTSKPRPAFSLDELRHGYEACAKNALRLVGCARRCLEPSASKLWQENYGLGLALGVLALEEIGKFCLIDATLFSFANDDVVREVRKQHAVHKSKLHYLGTWPFVIKAMLDKSAPDRDRRLALAAATARCRSITTRMEAWLPGPDFTLLDRWKQRGFYVAISDNRFEAPPEAVPRDRAVEVVDFAHALAQATAEHGVHNLGPYLDWAATLRRSLTPDRIDTLRKALATDLD